MYLVVLKKCKNDPFVQLGGVREAVGRKVELNVFGRSVKMQERPFCVNVLCERLLRGEGGRRLQNASAPERESNIKKGCKMTLICAEQPTLQLNTAYGLKCLPELQRMVWRGKQLGTGRERDRRVT